VLTGRHGNARVGVRRRLLPDRYRTHTAFQPIGPTFGRTLIVSSLARRGETLNRRRSFAAALALLAVAGVALTAWTSIAGASSAGGSLTGAGSTFVQPLVSKWSSVYHWSKINYSGIGSGGGIAAISARSVDFGASDAPLSPDQFSACHGCVQIPWAFSATSIPYNVSGVGYGLKLTGPIVASIYLGKITRWNDRRIKAINPKVKLPDEKITPIYRSDGSGTTYNFTDYLSHVSKPWKSKIGKGTLVSFPAGVGARGSSGVSGTLSRTPGGITYVDVAYSLKNKFKIAALGNRAGKFELPGLRQIRAAAASITKLRNSQNAYTAVDPNPRQPTAYPICTFTWVIAPLKTGKAAELKRFIDWALTKGQPYGPKLLFVPLPQVVKQAARKTVPLIHT
jgi:phosphate transport system substrate-binding protein